MSDRVHVLAFAGSLRKKSYNAGLIRAAVELVPPGMTVEHYDLSSIPLYNADLDTENPPVPVLDFKRRIAAADALLIATPEYNYSVSGVLKNAIDWASRRMSVAEASPLTGKPAAIMGAGGRFGTVRAQSHLRYILLYNDVKVLAKPEIMVVRAWEHFDEQGRLTDEATRKQIGELLAGLQAWTQLLQSTPPLSA